MFPDLPKQTTHIALLTIIKKSPTRFAWKGFYVRVIMRILSILIFFSRSFPSRPHPTPTEKNRKTTSPTPPPLQSTTQAQISQALLHVIPRNWTVSNHPGSKLVAFLILMLFLFLYFYFFFSVPGLSKAKESALLAAGNMLGRFLGGGV